MEELTPTTTELIHGMTLCTSFMSRIMNNLLDARHAISVTERQRFILRVRGLARGVAAAYLESREKLGFPLAKDEVRQTFMEEVANGK